MSGDKRTVAFQVPGELFERFKDYLQEKGIKQNAFFLDCIHRALAEAQEECKAAGDTATEGHVEQEGRLPEEAVAETEGETDGCDEDTEESSTEGLTAGRDPAGQAGSLPVLEVFSCSSTQTT